MTGIAIMTPSYSGDFDRCRLLCASIDHFVTGLSMHYLMVEAADAPLFRALEGPRRKVISDADLLPGWLKPVGNPLPIGPRRLWLSARGWPMRGWHVQQLRKLALPGVAPEDIYVICDSDVVFVRPYDLSSVMAGNKVSFFRRQGAITADMTALGHVDWCRMAASVLGLPPPVFPHNDYIDNLIIWDRPHVLALQDRIETVAGRSWMEEMVRWRSFSEAMLYGVFVENFTPEDFATSESPLCRTCWVGERLTEADIAAFLSELAPDQVAIGLQSFIDVAPEALWRLFEARARLSAPEPAACM